VPFSQLRSANGKLQDVPETASLLSIHELVSHVKLIVTGAAGFIGMHTAARLLDLGHEVVGVDNLSSYYDVRLKEDRLAQLRKRNAFRFVLLDVADPKATADLFASERPDRVIHLAAQAGVRYSLQNPMAYATANLLGFTSILQACRNIQLPHLVFASSSSVYGNNRKLPFAEGDPVDHPLSLYAASKRANELMAHAFAHLHGLPVTGLRFFTVYGPWGRPDMAPFQFAQAIAKGETIRLFNQGRHRRDFTFIDDIVEGVVAVALSDGVPQAEPGRVPMDPATSPAPFRLYNIGNSTPVELMDFLQTLESCLGKKARYEMVSAQPGDVLDTWADCSALERDFDYRPRTSLRDGMEQFIEWLRNYRA